MPECLAPDLDGPDIADRVTANGLELAYEQFGDDADPALVLIMGLGTQLRGWPDAFCRELACEGLRVIRFDNRDCGLSTKFDAASGYDSPRKAFIKSQLRRPIGAVYTLDDMVADTVGLLDALGIERAHIVGASMGGMIGQLMAAGYPNRVATLTSIMSSSGAPRLPRARLKVLMRLGKPPKNNEPETVARHMAKTMRMIGSPRIGRSLDDWTREIRRNIQRSWYPAGTQRQMLAVMRAGSRADTLATIRQPTLVIHGDADPLIPVAHGRDTATRIAGARYAQIPGMGHDLPPRLLPRLVKLIADLTRDAQSA